MIFGSFHQGKSLQLILFVLHLTDKDIYKECFLMNRL